MDTDLEWNAPAASAASASSAGCSVLNPGKAGDDDDMSDDNPLIGGAAVVTAASADNAAGGASAAPADADSNTADAADAAAAGPAAGPNGAAADVNTNFLDINYSAGNIFSSAPRPDPFPHRSQHEHLHRPVIPGHDHVALQ